MTFTLALVLASMAAVGVGLAVQRMIRDAAAAHAVLLAALLLPPVLVLAVLLGLRVPSPEGAPPHVAVDLAPAEAVAAPAGANWFAVLGAIWLAGALIGVARIVVEARRWRGVAARAEAIENPLILLRYEGAAALARSAEVSEPTVIGIVAPVVVLPAAYDLEPKELDAVFAHELAHIARRDNLTALVVQLVCAAFWFDPLHRVARRKLVELRERVCDDLVLARGCDAQAYASALARSCETSLQNPAVACMSRLRLEERMESIMSHETRRRWPASITRTLLAVAIAVAAVGFATFAPAPVLFAGQDEPGAYGFDVRAVPHSDGRYTLNVRIDTPDGAFSSVAVVRSAPDTRTISTTHGGKTHEVVVSLAADGSGTGTLTVREGNSVVATRTASFARQEPDVVQDAEGQLVTRPRVIHQVEPHYPEDALEQRIAGVVIIEAAIDDKGNVTSARVLKGLPFGLSEAAAEAVRQWKFEPGLLEGKPVATKFNVTIAFRPN